MADFNKSIVITLAREGGSKFTDSWPTTLALPSYCTISKINNSFCEISHSKLALN